MNSLAVELVILGVFAGLMGLDRRGAFQVMVSQPIVALPVLGLLIGAVETGVMLGALVQLLWMSSSLFGANVPPNETVAALTIGGMVFFFEQPDQPSEPAVWALAVLIGAPISLAGRWIEQKNDQANQRLARRADAAARIGRPKVIEWQTWRGLIRAFLLNALLVVTATTVGWALLLSLRPLLREPTTLAALAGIALYVLPAIGLGVSLANIRRRRGVVLALVTFIIAIAAGGLQ